MTYDNWKTTEPDPYSHEQPHRHQRKIVTMQICPPIPSRHYDWMACYADEEERGEYGYGSTEAQAIADLAMSYGEEEPS